jgi:hypothetical protein
MIVAVDVEEDKTLMALLELPQEMPEHRIIGIVHSERLLDCIGG